MEKTGLIKAAVIAAALLFLCAFFFESALTAFVVFVILAVISLLQKKAERSLRMKKAAVYFVMFLLTMVITMANDHFARKNAGRIIAAAENYAQRTGAYPGQLADLVPEFLPVLPIAKYTLNDNDFKYIARGKQHILTYVKKPPYGKVYYVFEEKRWGTTD